MVVQMLVRYNNHLRFRGVTPASIEARMRVLHRFQEWFGRPIEEASHDELVAWLETHSDLAARTRYGYVSHLACLWRWMVLEGHVERDETVRLARPKLRRTLPRPVGTDDVATALQAAQEAPLRAMVALASFAGLRCAEISGLTRGDVLERREPPLLAIAHGAKGGRHRVVPMHEIVRASLVALPLPARGPLFDLDPGQVSRKLRRHLHGCGVEASAHQLRHWFATEAYEVSGGDLRMIQELLGHASPTTTAIYTAWSQGRASSVVAALELGDSRGASTGSAFSPLLAATPLPAR